MMNYEQIISILFQSVLKTRVIKIEKKMQLLMKKDSGLVGLRQG